MFLCLSGSVLVITVRSARCEEIARWRRVVTFPVMINSWTISLLHTVRLHWRCSSARRCELIGAIHNNELTFSCFDAAAHDARLIVRIDSARSPCNSSISNNSQSASIKDLSRCTSDVVCTHIQQYSQHFCIFRPHGAIQSAFYCSTLAVGKISTDIMRRAVPLR